jgi:F0F1-type ATP synthase beta subunit
VLKDSTYFTRRFDSLPEQAFYLVGAIGDVIEKANTLAK